MKNITRSVAMIAVVAALAIGGTVAYFSDTEVSTGNTFTAGTIDIAVNSPQTWQYALEDMKPGYIDYSNFVVRNDGDNPVNVWKKVDNAITTENGTNEPELAAYSALGYTVNDLASVVKYDLSVVVKVGGVEKWNQTLYNLDKTVAQINAMGGNGTFLGMIPVGGTMDVTESYHMDEAAGNEHQSDKMTFDITLYGEQLKGEVVLEDKGPAPDWMVKSGNATMATLKYAVKGDDFDFTLAGKSPIISGNVALVAGYDSGTNPNKLLGYGTTSGDGTITMNTSSVELGGDLTSAKVWLIPKGDWDDTNKKVINWNMSQYLWETGMIDYYDTNN